MPLAEAGRLNRLYQGAKAPLIFGSAQRGWHILATQQSDSAPSPPPRMVVGRPTLPPPSLHLPYEAGPYRMALGLVAIAEAQWLEIDGEYPAHLAERRRLLAERRPAVVAATPGSESAQHEVLATLAAHLARHYPDWFRHDGDSLENRLTHERHDLKSDDVLGLAGRLVQEDFCLLQAEPDGLRLIAAVLCFPGRWRLTDKIGRLLDAIHGPVPFYPERLARPVDRFLSLLKTGRLAKRMSWSVIDDPDLFQPTGHGATAHAAGITPENAGATLVLRVERQTFRRLPETGVVVFGIRTHVTPLVRVTALPGEAARLREAILAFPPEMGRYKSLLPFRPALLAYLDRRAEQDRLAGTARPA